jgi:hypothetical protein
MPWRGCHNAAQAAVMSTLTSPPPPSTGGPSGPAYSSLPDAICRQVQEPSQATRCHGSGDDEDDVPPSPKGEICCITTLSTCRDPTNYILLAHLRFYLHLTALENQSWAKRS